jgi:glutamate carboxypeptidase
MDVAAIYSHVEKQELWIRNSLEKLVKQESPSEDRQAVNAAMALAASWAQALGARVKFQIS